LLIADEFQKNPVSWSPDSRFILYITTRGTTGNGANLWVLPLFGDRKPFPFHQSPYAEVAGQFSPDGRWVAYASNESGKFEVYVAPFPGPGGKWLISTAGGTFPRWRPDGTEIFYLAPDQTLMAATVNGKGGSVEVGAVKPLFKPAVVPGPRPYDVARDGQRFLINLTSEQAATAPITVVLNWTAALKK
jgi:hypothetical protein